MKLRTWLSAVFAITLVSLSAGPGLADGRTRKLERYQPASAARAQAHIAQARTGRTERAAPAPAPARAKQARMEPRPPANASRQRASSTELRAGRRGRP